MATVIRLCSVPNNIDLPYHDLLEKCEAILLSLKFNTVQAKNIQMSTRDQLESKHWFRFKAGCITASKFKEQYIQIIHNHSVFLARELQVHNQRYQVGWA